VAKNMQDGQTLSYFIKGLEKLYAETHIYISLGYLDDNETQPNIELLNENKDLIAGFLMFDAEIEKYLTESNI
jgi:hypothetical protein